MLRDFFVFTLGVVATSYGMWIATIYEDKYVIGRIQTMKRQLHLLRSEPRVDMDWFDETLVWSPNDKRIALENHNARPLPDTVQSDPVVKIVGTDGAPKPKPIPIPNPFINNSSEPNVGERPSKTNKHKLNHLFENGVDKEHLPSLLKNIAVIGNNINTAAGIRMVGLGSEAANDFDYVPPSPFPDSYERRTKSELVQFVAKNVNTFRGDTVREFIRAVPPPYGAGDNMDDIDAIDILSWLDDIEMYSYHDCKTYARLVRKMYEQVQLLFESEPYRIETPTIQRIN